MLLLLACAAPDLTGFFVDLRGKVVDPDGLPVSGATVTLTTADDVEVGVATTDGKGAFSLPVYGSTLENNVLIGAVSATQGLGEGRARWEVNLKSPEIEELRTGPGETWTGVARTLTTIVLAPAADRATATGKVVDAQTGFGLPGVPLTLQWGWNASVGDEAITSTTTGADGSFTVEADRAGVYTVFATGPAGYGTARFGATLTGEGGWSRGALAPLTDPGEITAALVWGDAPSDLDLHLSAPLRGGAVGTDGNGAYHIWSGDTTHPDNLASGADLEAELARADSDGEGPECVRVYGAPGEGEVRLSVVDNAALGDEESTALGLSRATVQLWNGEDTPRYFSVAPGQIAVAWRPVTLAVPEATVWVTEEYYTSIDPAEGDDF